MKCKHIFEFDTQQHKTYTDLNKAIGGYKMNENKDNLKEEIIKKQSPHPMFAVGTSGTGKKSYINELTNALRNDFK